MTTTTTTVYVPQEYELLKVSGKTSQTGKPPFKGACCYVRSATSVMHAALDVLRDVCKAFGAFNTLKMKITPYARAHKCVLFGARPPKK